MKTGKDVKLPPLMLFEKSGLSRKRRGCLTEEVGGWVGGWGRRRLGRHFEAPALVRRQRLLEWFQDFDLVTF